MSIELKQGDIIVFKPDDWLGKIIARLTNSDVSHSAMMYSENSIIETGAYGILVDEVKISKGRGAYIMRLNKELDPAPLIQAANQYYKSEVKFDYPALLLLAGLLVYKKITPDISLFTMINRILSEVCLDLDKYIQKVILHHNDRAMVCSQFVYQIFSDCEACYHIHFSQSEKTKLITPYEKSKICLMEMADQLVAENTLINVKHTFDEQIQKNFEPIRDKDMEEFYKILCKSEVSGPSADGKPTNAFPDLKKTVQLTRHFIEKVKNMLSLSKSKIPLDAMFVTSADLVYHSSNLVNKGLVSLVRVFPDE